MSVLIQGLSKKYKVYQETNRTLAETLAALPKKLFGRSQKHEDFWALRDIDLEINQGDLVGIIGRNGAGKSTLLKIISKITPPTGGQIKTNGRVASLLEVGTGFHLELTGRENIFLNGAILGLKRREIKARFDEIVDFAEVSPFLDTPVKRYSSGMLARLGFAVAAHLDPDILICDEVLAVGDKPFQEKCLKKLNDHGKNGRTVLFVSHNVGSILALCQKGIFLEQGRLKMFGPIEECIHQYTNSYVQKGKEWIGDLGNEHLRLLKASLTSNGRDFYYNHETVVISIEVEVRKPDKDLFLGLEVWDKNQILASSYTSLPKGTLNATFTLPLCSLYEGEYYLKIAGGLHNKKTIAEVALSLTLFHTQNTRYQGKEGVFLGNRWELK